MSIDTRVILMEISEAKIVFSCFSSRECLREISPNRLRRILRMLDNVSEAQQTVGKSSNCQIEISHVSFNFRKK